MAKMKYKISSRATILLGRESVSKVEGALIELIKNTYDADATLCYVYFETSENALYIIDDGTGMTKSVIEDNWMMIGTANKRDEYISEKDRIKSGEKGIGRFALDRLGSLCEMYTKNANDKFIKWSTNWNSFEEAGKTLDEIEADFDYLNTNIYAILPECVKREIKLLEKKLNEDRGEENEVSFIFKTGTVLKISGLRDDWKETTINNLINSLGFLIPPEEQDEFYISIQKSKDSGFELIENNLSEEFDYKINANFDGSKFEITMERNEFDLSRMPDDVFREERFLRYPYRKEDFEKKVFTFNYPISQLFSTDDEELIAKIKEIGEFKFKYIFMKLSMQGESQDVYFYKTISKTRKNWLDEHGGVKIYRDNFLVRPYGDVNSDSYDWLGLEARYNSNPVAVSSKSEAWSVRNAQGQGTIFISRITNGSIIDKSSREGLIENESFKLFKETIIKIISVFEHDRAYIARTLKQYDDRINEKEKTKREGTALAQNILKNKKDNKSAKSKLESLAKTVKYYEEERDELITELKLLRSLATNGLITSSIVHDLKSINAILVTRVDSMRLAFENNNLYLIERNLNDLYKNDTFLKSWISVISNQSKKDKRRRLKKDLYVTIKNIVDILDPILKQKKVELLVNTDNKATSRRIFESDYESIMYNLIINSIEAFSKSDTKNREIVIDLKTEDKFIIIFTDNGKGIGSYFKDPYDIFKFGTTSKYDQEGNVIGTGLGMYIVASTIREYNGDYRLLEVNNGFSMEMKFPI
ncbi:GHKL domain-containing protein [Lachnotalea glycerini]|uniref:GHKL domain-containing protein n=1 Tax=Lachnotalea glycerini TaxID=1763509 RepID=A0A318ETE9_9FIRM|nr:ATP-binding protein [Lachnotalea glycerini]PXV91661.1 GHKL domain-containing protein [Lachnotalea glycerini]